MFGYDESDHLATPSEACREWAWNVGEDFPDSQWLLSDYDTWERNPHYRGPAQEHPYDAEARQDAEIDRADFACQILEPIEGANFVEIEVLDADLPF